MIDHVVIVKPSIGKALAMMAEQRIETPAVLTKAEKTFKNEEYPKIEFTFLSITFNKGFTCICGILSTKTEERVF